MTRSLPCLHSMTGGTPCTSSSPPRRHFYGDTPTGTPLECPPERRKQEALTPRLRARTTRLHATGFLCVYTVYQARAEPSCIFLTSFSVERLRRTFPSNVSVERFRRTSTTTRPIANDLLHLLTRHGRIPPAFLSPPYLLARGYSQGYSRGLRPPSGAGRTNRCGPLSPHRCLLTPTRTPTRRERNLPASLSPPFLVASKPSMLTEQEGDCSVWHYEFLA